MQSNWIIKKIVIYIVGLVAFILAIQMLFGRGGLIERLLGINISFLTTVLTLSSIPFFMSALIKALIVFRFSKIISSALRGLGLALLAYSFIESFPYMPTQILSINHLLFACIIVAIFSYVGKAVARLYHEPILGDISTVISLLLMGFIMADMVRLLLSPLSLPLGLSRTLHEIVFWSYTITAIVSALSTFRIFPNPYLRFIGAKVSSSLSGIFLLLFLVLLYFSNIRPQILKLLGAIVPISAVEWGVICLSFYLFYIGLKRYVRGRLTEELCLGTWVKHRQKMEHYINPEQINLAGIVEEFVEYGKKDGIIAYLASTLLINGASIENVRSVIAKIIDYQDIPYPKICLRPWVKGIDEENKRRRMKVLWEVINNVGWAIGEVSHKTSKDVLLKGGV